MNGIYFVLFSIQGMAAKIHIVAECPLSRIFGIINIWHFKIFSNCVLGMGSKSEHKFTFISYASYAHSLKVGFYSIFNPCVLWLWPITWYQLWALPHALSCWCLKAANSKAFGIFRLRKIQPVICVVFNFSCLIVQLESMDTKMSMIQQKERSRV